MPAAGWECDGCHRHVILAGPRDFQLFPVTQLSCQHAVVQELTSQLTIATRLSAPSKLQVAKLVFNWDSALA